MCINIMITISPSDQTDHTPNDVYILLHVIHVHVHGIYNDVAFTVVVRVSTIIGD